MFDHKKHPMQKHGVFVLNEGFVIRLLCLQLQIQLR